MKKRRNRNGFTPKAALFSGAAALMFGGVVYSALANYGRPVADEYGCYHVSAQALVDVWVDASEPRWNEEQARSLRAKIDEIYDDLPFNVRLNVFSSEGDQVSSVPVPRFHVCGAARSPEDLKRINAAPAEPGFLAKQKQRVYETKLAPELDALLAITADETRRQSAQSPVLESIQNLSRLRAGAKIERSLIIVSDLLENGDAGKFCQVPNAMPPFAAYKQRPVYQRIKPEPLDGVRITVLFLQRAGYGQPDLEYCRDEDEIITFYRDYFIDNGASDPRVIRIRHGYGANL